MSLVHSTAYSKISFTCGHLFAVLQNKKKTHIYSTADPPSHIPKFQQLSSYPGRQAIDKHLPFHVQLNQLLDIDCSMQEHMCSFKQSPLCRRWLLSENHHSLRTHQWLNPAETVDNRSSLMSYGSHFNSILQAALSRLFNVPIFAVGSNINRCHTQQNNNYEKASGQHTGTILSSMLLTKEIAYVVWGGWLELWTWCKVLFSPLAWFLHQFYFWCHYWVPVVISR